MELVHAQDHENKRGFLTANKTGVELHYSNPNELRSTAVQGKTCHRPSTVYFTAPLVFTDSLFSPSAQNATPIPNLHQTTPYENVQDHRWLVPPPIVRIQVNVDDHLQNCTTHPAGCRNHRYYTYGSWHAACTVRMANTSTGQRRQIL